MIGKHVKCICKECIEYGLCGLVVRKEVTTIGLDKRIMYDVVWNDKTTSTMYEYEIKEVR